MLDYFIQVITHALMMYVKHFLFDTTYFAESKHLYES